jgi:hypothetical protein
MSSATFFQSLIRRFAALCSRLFLALREPAQIRNLLLFALMVIGLLGLRQLNCVPYRLKVYDDNNRIETVADFLGSYYRPIRDGQDVGLGVRYHNMFLNHLRDGGLPTPIKLFEQRPFVETGKAHAAKRLVNRISSGVPVTFFKALIDLVLGAPNGWLNLC